MSSSHLLDENIVLNSKFAVSSNTYKNRCYFELKKQINLPSNVHPYIQLINMKYSNVFYNISESQNMFWYDFGGAIESIIIPAGNYNLNALIIAMSENGFVLTYDEISLKLTISNSSSFRILDGNNSINSKLGIIPFNNYVTSHVAQNAINLVGVTHVQILMENLNLSSNSTTGSQNNVLDICPNDKRIGSSISYSPFSNTKIRIGIQNITSISVVLLDEDGNDLDFLGSDWVMMIHMSFHYPIDYKPDINLMSDLGQTQINENV